MEFAIISGLQCLDRSQSIDFENMLQYDERDLDGRTRLEVYIPDTASATAMAKTYANNNDNKGLAVRSALFDDGKTVQVIINLIWDP